MDSSSSDAKAPAQAQPAEVCVNKYDAGWRYFIRNFSPSWFSVTMGTGVVSVLFFSIPYEVPALYYLSIVFFMLNIALFALAAAVSIARYGLYPEIWHVMVHDPKNSLFLGTVPMGFATLVEMVVFVVCPAWGGAWPTVALVLWVVDSVAAVAVTITLGVIIISATDPMDLSEITATQLLPIASCIVAAGTGSRLATALPDPDLAAGVILASYVLWGMGVPLAMCALVLYYNRLILHKHPPKEIIVSSFLPLGPLGFGGNAIMYLGKASQAAFPAAGILAPHSAAAADVFFAVGFLLALVMWAFGLIWLAFAVAAIARSWRSMPFNMGWWGFTFPIGVYAASTIQIGKEMPSEAFRVMGTVLAAAVILLWCVVAAGTVRGAWSGKLFQAPCLQALKPEYVDKGKVRVTDAKKA